MASWSDVAPNGIVTWMPTEAQGPSTNVVTVSVTDNGVTPMAATSSFTVIVREVNVAPVLPAQTNRAMSELTLLTVTNAATDADYIATHAKSLLTMIVVTNPDRVAAFHGHTGAVSVGQDAILDLDLAAEGAKTGAGAAGGAAFSC